MNMQVHSIVLYNKDGMKRHLRFRLGAVNIITGESSTGKSSIIDIIDFCMGQSRYLVPEGVIRDTVSWYATIFQFDGSQVLIAKPAPEPGSGSQSSVYLEIGTEIEPPEASALKPNSNDEGVIETLTRLVGIGANKNVPSIGQTRLALEASIRHTTYYLFQDQNLIANPESLFHQQSQPFIPQAIRDTLPYFLGSLPSDKLVLENQLRRERRKLKQLHGKLYELQEFQVSQYDRGLALFAEAQQVGLIEGAIEPVPQQVIELLSQLNVSVLDRIHITGDEKVTTLQNEIQRLRRKFRVRQEQVRKAEEFLKGGTSFGEEIAEQKRRLESINILPLSELLPNSCPLCDSVLGSPLPRIEQMKQSMNRLEQDLLAVRREESMVGHYIEELRHEVEQIRETLKRSETMLRAALEQREETRKLADSRVAALKVLGRISLYLETVTDPKEILTLEKMINTVQRKIDAIERKIGPDESRDRLTSVLNVLAQQMTEWAATLGLEFRGSPYRLDENRLTVVADRPNSPIPMDRMGGGENYLGCHLITLLALHKYYSEQRRPVPQFLILDQPSQVYFPNLEEYKNLRGTIEDFSSYRGDISKVSRLFDFLFDVAESISPNIQIFVLEHARLETSRFSEALVEDSWDDGRALIPPDWLPSLEQGAASGTGQSPS